MGTSNGLRGRRCAAPARGHELFDRRGAHVAASRTALVPYFRPGDPAVVDAIRGLAALVSYARRCERAGVSPSPMDVRTDPWRGGSGHSLCLVGTVRRFPRDFPRSVYPVCSPKLLAEGQAIHGAHDFGGYPLIHFDWFANHPTAPNWEGGSRRHRPPRAPTDRAIRMHKKNRRVAARHPFFECDLCRAPERSRHAPVASLQYRS